MKPWHYLLLAISLLCCLLRSVSHYDGVGIFRDDTRFSIISAHGQVGVEFFRMNLTPGTEPQKRWSVRSYRMQHSGMQFWPDIQHGANFWSLSISYWWVLLPLALPAAFAFRRWVHDRFAA